jgi:hypothetical protein
MRLDIENAFARFQHGLSFPFRGAQCEGARPKATPAHTRGKRTVGGLRSKEKIVDPYRAVGRRSMSGTTANYGSRESALAQESAILSFAFSLFNARCAAKQKRLSWLWRKEHEWQSIRFPMARSIGLAIIRGSI